MTLSFWFRDYLYIPLGGNRCGRFRKPCKSANHNAPRRFMARGCLDIRLLGFLSRDRADGSPRMETYRHGRQPIGHPFLQNFLAVATTFGFVAVGWIFFRANTLTDLLAMLSCMTGLGSAGLTGNLNTDHWDRVYSYCPVLPGISLGNPLAARRKPCSLDPKQDLAAKSGLGRPDAPGYPGFSRRKYYFYLF